MIEFNLDIKFTNKEYKSFLKRLKKFGTYVATVGIHKEEGQKKVIRRYSNPMSKKSGSHYAGKSHRMTIAKLAYQNEFGANIVIKPRYKTLKKTKTEKVLHTLKQRITINNVTKYRALRSSNEQGYLLVNKVGDFVAYFQPNSIITIPERSFIRETAKKVDGGLSSSCSTILQSILINRSLAPKQGMENIAQLVENKMKHNIRSSTPPNHDLTRKAKGFNQPLVDEQDRLLKSIKYKIYKFNQTSQLGLSGNTAYLKQFETQVDKLLESAKQYEKDFISVNQEIKTKTFARYNPKFMI